jgi:hypothetical protein
MGNVTVSVYAQWLATIAVSGAFAACSGGGGSEAPPPVTFSFATASGSIAEGAAPLAMSVVLHTTMGALVSEASVQVVDSALGTATSGSDYAPFAPVTITFPVGSVNGDAQPVMFGALDDHSIEGVSETVRFALAGGSGGVASGTMTFAATVTDVDFATIQFASTSSTMVGESGVPHEITISLDLPPATTLGVAATARFADAGSGSATPGADYAVITQQTISFPAGSADGATLSASVLVLDDAAIEADEIVRLAISNPGVGTVLGANTLHAMTIEDDDATPDSALVVTQGATGTENALAYDALVDLGSQVVAGGPNAGTLVRATNAGGSPMDLGAPSLSGTNPNDFDVVVDAAPLAPPPAPGTDEFVLAPSAAAPFTLSSTTTGPGIAFALDPERIAELAAMPRATLQGFPVPGLGDVTLDLHRVNLPIAANAVLNIDGTDVPGGIAALVGNLTAWSGSVLELPGSRAFLSFSSEGARGFLELPVAVDRFVHLLTEQGPGPAGQPATGRIVRSPELAALGAGGTPDICGGEREVPGVALDLDLGAQDFAPPSTESLTAANCRIAIETDYQFFQKFGASPAATTYVTQLMAAISDQYFTDVQTTLSIAYLGLHTTAADGWTSQDSGGDSGALLDEFRTAWNTSGWPVQANLAHFVSGASLGGGIAYVNVLCNQSFGYGVSGDITGGIDWGTWTGAPGNFTWDFVVIAHEMGHNFGSSHTHSYCPPLDLCYANCNGTTACSQGTIMSYCHTCGGMDNIDLYFHPVCANIMRNAVNSSCLADGMLTAGDYVQYRVRFNPLTATGVRTANLQFTHDAPNATQPFRMRLTATAQ